MSESSAQITSGSGRRSGWSDWLDAGLRLLHGEFSWRHDARRRRWTYRGSERGGRKPYSTAEYVLAKLEGRPPSWNIGTDESAEFEDLIARLHDLGWRRRNPACRCGANAGESGRCVVLYARQGVVFHAAVYDRGRQDWGGKLGADGPIVRFAEPVDYLCFTDKPVDGAQMWFFCPKPATTKTVRRRRRPLWSDEKLHDEANASAVQLACPAQAKPINVTIARVGTGRSKKSARHRASRAASRKAIQITLAKVKMHRCAPGCSKRHRRVRSDMRSNYTDRGWLRLPWQHRWVCETTYTRTSVIYCEPR